MFTNELFHFWDTVVVNFFSGSHLFHRCIARSKPCNWWDKRSGTCDITFCPIFWRPVMGLLKLSVLTLCLQKAYILVANGTFVLSVFLLVLQKSFPVFSYSLINCRLHYVGFIASISHKVITRFFKVSKIWQFQLFVLLAISSDLWLNLCIR